MFHLAETTCPPEGFLAEHAQRRPSSRRRRVAQFGSPPTPGQDETVSDRTTADLERELAMLAYVRDRLRASEGEGFRIPTTAVDQVLDELNSLERSPWDPA